ncbi:BlaI/MecI/CopY family transcriptional regulator [Caproiciproducens sp. LBM24188]|nr:BlaI/MecI/CopY family transcriptional regulator [Oscillospiraceae bacterium]HHV30983.1 BlaI/MecI/CopY family transcriptional regulator [Clostridiales bacterium]
MKTLPQISDAEFEVMDIIWKYAPISTNEITERLAQKKEWSPKTIYTMLSRLEKKSAIRHEKESRVFIYTPCVKKEDYLEAESRRLASRFFDGAMDQMVVSFLNQRELSPKDLEELQEVLDKKRRS